MKNNEDDYVFPKHIREGFEGFEIPGCENWAKHPAFIDKLLRVTVSDEERKGIWEKMGRPEAYDLSLEYEKDE